MHHSVCTLDTNERQTRSFLIARPSVSPPHARGTSTMGTAAELFDLIVATNDDGGDDSCTIDNMEAFAASVKGELAGGGEAGGGGGGGGGGGDGAAAATDGVIVDVDEVVAAANDGAVVLDVRSPGEFSKGHVPGAVNVPLFTDDERAKVGTAFAKQGRGVAMVMGMKCVRPKLPGILQTALDLAAARAKQLRDRRGAGEEGEGSGTTEVDAPVKVYVHCWRGGMRSSSVTWFLRHSCHTQLAAAAAAAAAKATATTAGEGGPHNGTKTTKNTLIMDVRVMRGGYKSFRRWALSRWATKGGAAVAAGDNSTEISTETDFAIPAPYGPRVCIVGGRTGVGKTRALLALRAVGEQVIDLEGLAAHSGSAFGWVGRPPEQPTSEHFSNLVACEWAAMSPSPRWCYVEDEGPHVGKCSVDPGLFQRMRHAPLVVNVVAPREVRLQVLVEDYAGEQHRADDDWLPVMKESVGKLHKRLGGERASDLQARLEGGDYTAVAEGLLEYYDGLYDRHLGNKRVEKHVVVAKEEAQKPRSGKMVEVAAFAIGEEAAGRTGRHPHSLDIERLAADILRTVARFEEEEEEEPNAATTTG